MLKRKLMHDRPADRELIASRLPKTDTALCPAMWSPMAARSLRSSRLEGRQALRADQVGHRHACVPVLVLEVLDVSSTHVEEASEAQAGAVELADDQRGLVIRNRNEIGSPEQRQLVLGQAQRLQVDGNLILQLLLDISVWEVSSIRLENRGLGLATHTTDVDIVLDPVQLRADHHEASLALVDARKEALIHHLTTCLDTTLEVLACALGCPRARLVRPAIDAELDELCHGVLLDVVVVGLLQDQHLIVSGHAIAEVRTILALVLELDDPNSLTRRTTILLDHSRLKRHGLARARVDALRRVVAQGVLKAEVHCLNLAQSILGTRLLHRLWCWPNRDLGIDLHHIGIELLLVPTVRCDLPGVDANDDAIPSALVQHLDELIVLGRCVEDDRNCNARVDQAVCDGNGVEAVPVNKLVTATCRVRENVRGQQGHLVLRALGRWQQSVVALGPIAQAKLILSGSLCHALRNEAKCCDGFGSSLEPK